MLPTYHLLREPETAIDYRFCQETFDAGRYCDIPSFEFAPKGLENLSESWWLKIPTPLKHMRKSNWESSPGMKITFLKPPPVVKFPFPIFGVNMKFNMEPERTSLEKEIPFGNPHFQVPCYISGEESKWESSPILRGENSKNI